MCNLYSITRTQEAMRRLFRVHRDFLGNFPGLPAVFPDTMAPVVHTARDGERELTALGLSATAKSRPGAGHQCPQSGIVILARLAKSRVALSCSRNVFLRVDGQPAEVATMLSESRLSPSLS
jgi:putative SOS response-associated peptidase YedK